MPAQDIRTTESDDRILNTIMIMETIIGGFFGIE
jgi:hypothetical protein